MIVLVGLERYRPANPYEGASVYPACQNLLLAAHALGYGGALTGWHHAVEPELRSLLGIPDRRRPVGVHHARRARRAPRPAAPQAVATLVHDARWGRRRHVARGPGRWLTTPTPCSASSRGVSEDELRAARRRLAQELHPDHAGGTTDGHAPAQPRLRRRAGRCPRRRPGLPEAAADVAVRAPPRPCPDPGGRLAHDVASFTIEALPVEAFEALLIVATWLGEVLVDEPPYQLDVALGEPFECWCRLDLVPDAGSSTVALTLASLDGRPVPDLDAVRDAWVANLNTLGRPDPDAPDPSVCGTGVSAGGALPQETLGRQQTLGWVVRGSPRRPWSGGRGWRGRGRGRAGARRRCGRRRRRRRRGARRRAGGRR